MKKIILTALAFSNLIYAEDAVEKPTKKELINAIPHVWISADLLILKARENRLSIANESTSINSSNFTNRHLVKPTYEWNSGIRIDAGYQPKDIIFFANWTYIQNKTHSEKNTATGEGFFPVWTLGSGISSSDYVTSGSLDWTLNLNLIDIGVSRAWRVDDHFIIKPHGALRTAFLDQHFDIHYAGGYFANGMDRVRMNNSFFGMGPTAGLTPSIPLGGGFSLVGDISASALIGRFFIKQRENYLTASRYAKSHFATRLRWNLDAKAALSWQREIAYKALLISAQTGWEWHKFYDQNMLGQNSFEFFDGGRNLIMQGWFLALTIGF